MMRIVYLFIVQAVVISFLIFIEKEVVSIIKPGINNPFVSGGETITNQKRIVERNGHVFSLPDETEIVFIPGGEFLMGSDLRSEERPPHTVYVDAFYIDKYEVTKEMFRKYIESTGYSWNRSSFVPADFPIANISWEEAAAYAEWIGKRLPTEAEWEKAAKGTDNRMYPWGNKWVAGNCNVHSLADHHRGLAPVGSFERGKSFYGVCDLAGNVWEWCCDWFNKTYYQEGKNNNPRGPDHGKRKVLRGGGWSDIHYKRDVTRCSARVGAAPGTSASYIGFRCVIPASEFQEWKD